jgi:hypothetical protein
VQGFDERDDEQQEIQIIKKQPYIPSSLQNTEQPPLVLPGDNALIEDAQWTAIRHAQEIEELIESGKLVRIDQPKIEARIKDCVTRFLRDKTNGGPPPDRAERQRLMRVYTIAYQKRFGDEIGGEQEKVRYLVSPEQIHLREVAIQDRKEEPPRSYRDYHIRDLAVIRVMQVLHVPLDIARDALTEIHKLADFYQDCYSNPREEVIWPDQEFFR